MHCTRCHGLMVVDHFLDIQDDAGHLWLRAWRCVNCGAVAEPGMIYHKLAHLSLLTRLRMRRGRRAEPAPEVVPIGV